MRGAAEETRRREQQDRADEVPLAAEHPAEPTRERHDDDARKDVAGGNPGDFVERRAEVPHHVRERDVDDRVVDDLQQRRQDDRERDDVLMRGASGSRAVVG